MTNTENQNHHLLNPEIDAIGQMLKYAILPSFDLSGEENGTIDLTVECIWSAMNYLKQNPSKNIQDACDFALDEWIK